MVETSPWLQPEEFGFAPAGSGWRRTFGGREILFEQLNWEHSHSPSYDLIKGERDEIDALTLIERLQMRTWGFPPEEIVPTNALAIAADTGGGVLVAYDEELGFNADGWLGFLIGYGSSSGTFISHMMGVREERRGGGILGWSLKLLQALEAIKTGHRSMQWTYDPIRGVNARLNVEKLGATIQTFTIDKYGHLESALYGNVPTDRFTAYWDLESRRTVERLHGVWNHTYRSPTIEDVTEIEIATIDNAETLIAASAKMVKVEIPGDIDDVRRADPVRAVAWQRELREILPRFLATKRARGGAPGRNRPGEVTVISSPGAYEVNAFVTGLDETGARRSYYLLERLPNPSHGE